MDAARRCHSSEYIASVVQGVNTQAAVADAFCAHWVTTSPFKQRFLMRRGEKPTGVQALIRASVTQLSGASARALARIAAEDEAVAALREAASESLHAMRSLPAVGQREEAAELGRRLQARADALSRSGGNRSDGGGGNRPGRPNGRDDGPADSGLSSVQRWHCHRGAPR
jgi:hypothetical protein